VRHVRTALRHRFAHRRRSVAAPLLLLATLGLCSCARVVVLAADPWWSAVTGGSPALAREVTAAALRRGYLPTFVVVPVREDPRERLAEPLARLRPAAAVLGPPLSSDAGALASRFPDVTFVLVGGRGIEDGIANTVQISFDRIGAFREAGTIAAASGATAVLSAGGRSDAETAAFVERVLATPGAPAPVVRALSATPNRDELRTAVAALRAAGLSVFLYRPPSAGAQFLEALAEAGGCAVVEDWAASRPRPGQVLVSIEDDLPATVAAGLARGAPPLVSVPARLRRGSAGAAADGKAGGR